MKEEKTSILGIPNLAQLIDKIMFSTWLISSFLLDFIGRAP